MLNFFSNNNKSLIDAKTLQEILDEILSPRLEQMGLAKATSYSWHEQTLKEIRRGFSYMQLKGAAGTFTWGVTLDFLPTVLNSKVIYHKSAKKYLNHLFEWTDEYANSFAGRQLVGGVTTHFGLKEARKSIATLFEQYEQKIVSWFETANTIEKLITIAERQENTGKHYDLHHPGPKYVLAFLYAKANQIDKATKLFDTLSDYEFDNSEDIRQKLKARLLMLTEKKNGT